MSWIERTTKKRIKELDEHPELNSNDFEEKGNTLMKDIKFLVLCQDLRQLKYLFF